MRTHIEQQVERGVSRLLEGNDAEAWGAVLAQGRRKIAQGEFGWLPDFVYQYEARSSHVAEVDAYCLLQVHVDVVCGVLAIHTINVGREPHADAAVDENNAVLEALAPPFKGQFWGGKDGADGRIEWTEPVEMRQGVFEFGSQDETIIDAKPAIFAPASIPIEVGYTNAPKTLWQVRDSGLARWPYWSKHIIIMHRTGLSLPGSAKGWETNAAAA